MCCPLDDLKGRLNIQAITLESEGKENFYCVRGVYDRTPACLADRLVRIFQRLEWIEKLAEMADESFHLCGGVLKGYTSVAVYQTLSQLHHVAHDAEHFLHACCFLGDLSRLLTGKFFEHNASADYLRRTARICHMVAHFFATANFLAKQQLCSLGPLGQIVKYASACHALGYMIEACSLIWQRQRGRVHPQFASDLRIHLAGGIFEALPLFSRFPYAFVAREVSAIAGMIHAWSVMQRLMPKDQEEVMGHFKLSVPVDQAMVKEVCQADHHHLQEGSMQNQQSKGEIDHHPRDIH